MKPARLIWLVCVVAGLASALLNWFILRNAVWMAPDSWAFWQGSVSLLDQRGYRLFSNDQPIKEWPPLYSCYLAAWQALFGVSGKVLVAAQSALAGLATLAWTRLALALSWRDAPPANHYVWLAGYAQASFVAIFVATRYDCIRADNLKYVLLPILIGVVERTWSAVDRAQLLRQCAGIGALGMLLMLTHTSSVAFVAAAVFIVLLARNVSPSARIFGALLALVLALVPWLISRSVLEQSGSHQLGAGVAAYRPLSYLVQVIGGSSTLLIKQPWIAAPLAALLAFAAWNGLRASALPEPIRSALALRVLFVASAAFTLFALFNVTQITDKLTGRFVFFVPLTLVPAAISVLAWTERPSLLLAASGLTLLAAVPRVLDLSHGIQTSRDGLHAAPDQIALASDCIRRADALPSWKCSEGTSARLPPPRSSQRHE